MQEGQADEVQPSLAFNHAALLPGFTVVAKYGQVDPVEARMKATAPDDIVHGERLTVLKQRLTAARADYTRSALDACRREVTSLDSDQWTAFLEHTRPRLSIRWCFYRQDVMK